MCPASPQSITRCAMLMPGPGEIGASAHVGHLAYRSAVNPHPHRKFRVFLERFGNFERAPGGFFRTVAKDERHPIAGRQPNQLFVRRFPHRRRREHDFNELVQPLLLLLVQELRVTDDIDEEDMPNFEAKVVVGVRWHPISLAGGISGDHDYFVSFAALLTLACKRIRA